MEPAGFEGRILEKDSRCHGLSEGAKELNKVQSGVQHVFGAITTGRGGKLVHFEPSSIVCRAATESFLIPFSRIRQGPERP